MAARAPLLLACGLLLAALQFAASCDDCMRAGGGGGAALRRAMLRAHGEACARESGATAVAARALEEGPPPSAPSRALRRHLYCVLRRCGMLDTDGRPRLPAHLMAGGECRHSDSESVVGAGAGAPEDEAWKLFFCGCGDGDGEAGAAAGAEPTPADATARPAAAVTPLITESNVTKSQQTQ
nr:Uncharacterized protein/Odorant-binding related protein [Metisa plana]